MPMLVYAIYFVLLLATSGLWWSIHTGAGAVFLAGVVGWLMAVLVTLPAPAAAETPVLTAPVAWEHWFIGNPRSGG